MGDADADADGSIGVCALTRGEQLELVRTMMDEYMKWSGMRSGEMR